MTSKYEFPGHGQYELGRHIIGSGPAPFFRTHIDGLFEATRTDRRFKVGEQSYGAIYEMSKFHRATGNLKLCQVALLPDDKSMYGIRNKLFRIFKRNKNGIVNNPQIIQCNPSWEDEKLINIPILTMHKTD